MLNAVAGECDVKNAKIAKRPKMEDAKTQHVKMTVQQKNKLEALGIKLEEAALNFNSVVCLIDAQDMQEQVPKHYSKKSQEELHLSEELQNKINEQLEADSLPKGEVALSCKAASAQIKKLIDFR